MKRPYIVVVALLATLFLSISIYAAPAAELSMNITDVDVLDDTTEFTVNIGISKPSEPYASLDFSIVSSNSENLQIVDRSESGDRSNLDIEFPSEDYGGVYHKGRIDETSGAISYLVGVFSQESGNNISDEADICSVRFRYNGEAPAEISLDGLKLVYKNSNGDIDNAEAKTSIKQEVTLEALSGNRVPLSSAALGQDSESPSLSGYVFIVIAAVAVLFALQWIIRKRLAAKKM